MLVADVLDVFVAEVADGREHRVGRGLAQAAERRVLDHLAQVDEPLDVGLLAAAFADPVQDLEHPLRAYAARHALAARFFLHKFQEETGDVDHAAILVHHDQAAGAHDRAEFRERLVVQGHVQVVLGNAAAGGPAHLRGLELLARRGAAAHVVDQIAQGHADGHFHQAGILDCASQGEDLGAAALFRAVLGVPRAAVEDDRRHVGVGLDIVQERRFAPQAPLGGERRAGPRLAAIALDRGHQGRLFAAHEGPGTHADLHVEIETGTEDILAQDAPLLGLGDGDLQPRHGQRVFRPHVNKAARGADRVGGNGHAFDHAMRIAFQHATVHEGPRIAFIGVADGELGLAGRLAGQFPLLPGAKSGPAAAAKARNPHRLDDLVGTILCDDLGQGLVTVAGDVIFDPLRVDHAAVAEHDLDLPFEEIHLGRVGHLAAVGPAMRQPRDDLPAKHVLVDQRARLAA